MKKGLKYFLIFGAIMGLITFFLTLNIVSGAAPNHNFFIETIIDVATGINSESPIPISLCMSIIGFVLGGILGTLLWFFLYKVIFKEKDDLEIDKILKKWLKVILIIGAIFLVVFGIFFVVSGNKEARDSKVQMQKEVDKLFIENN